MAQLALGVFRAGQHPVKLDEGPQSKAQPSQGRSSGGDGGEGRGDGDGDGDDEGGDESTAVVPSAPPVCVAHFRDGTFKEVPGGASWDKLVSGELPTFLSP